MSIPVFSILAIIFVLWLHYEIKKNGKNAKKNIDSFWESEHNSNLVRRGDISQLNYLNISLEPLPMEDHEEDTINSYRDTIRTLSSKKMINLSDQTNTELKYQYGAANFTLLSEYDNNYTAFVSILQKWAERLYAKGFIDDAKAVLEFSIFSCLTDVTKAYRLLAELYQKQKTPEKIHGLTDSISKTKIIDKDKLIHELNTYHILTF